MSEVKLAESSAEIARCFPVMLHLRPHNRFEDVKQMYLVGGGTHPGSGLPVIFESARITSRLLLQDLKMEPLWNHAGEDAPIGRQLVGAPS